jgi:voltage-gated sodium channel
LIPAQCRRIAESAVFTNFILGVIVFTAVLMGLETSAQLMAAYGPLFRVLNGVVQAIFVAEIVIRLAAHWPRPGRFLPRRLERLRLSHCGRFAVAANRCLRDGGTLARLLRVARLLSVSAELRLIISTMLRSIPSLGNVTLLLGLLLYVYSIIGYHLFHVHDPKTGARCRRRCSRCSRCSHLKAGSKYRRPAFKFIRGRGFSTSATWSSPCSLL